LPSKCEALSWKRKLESESEPLANGLLKSVLSDCPRCHNSALETSHRWLSRHPLLRSLKASTCSHGTKWMANNTVSVTSSLGLW
jgi:hypothetical protein